MQRAGLHEQALAVLRDAGQLLLARPQLGKQLRPFALDRRYLLAQCGDLLIERLVGLQQLDAGARRLTQRLLLVQVHVEALGAASCPL